MSVQAVLAVCEKVDWLRTAPYVLFQSSMFALVFVGAISMGVGGAAPLFSIPRFAISGFDDRYLSHRTFKTSRPFLYMAGIRDATWSMLFALPQLGVDRELLRIPAHALERDHASSD